MWISQGTEDGKDCGFSSCQNIWIFAFTSRKPDLDDLHHINFYSIVKHRDGSYHAFDYKLDAIQTKFDKIVAGQFTREQASLSYGAFMWQISNEDSTLSIKQLSICSHRQYYNVELSKCELCEDPTAGTIEF